MIAIDTNVFIYAIDRRDATKRAAARALLKRLAASANGAVLLWQVAGARFGFGGMLGGLAAAGGLMAAGGGAAGAAINALALGSEASVEHAVAQLLATAIARNKLGLPRDDRIWFLLCELESQIARQLQGLVPFSDADAPSVKALERKARMVRRAIEYLVDHWLAPLLR